MTIMHTLFFESIRPGPSPYVTPPHSLNINWTVVCETVRKSPLLNARSDVCLLAARYTGAVTLDPSNANVNSRLYYNKALCLSRLGRTQQAIVQRLCLRPTICNTSGSITYLLFSLLHPRFRFCPGVVSFRSLGVVSFRSLGVVLFQSLGQSLGP